MDEVVITVGPKGARCHHCPWTHSNPQEIQTILAHASEHTRPRTEA